jgi:membrane protease YdiL (CAAX protease family)
MSRNPIHAMKDLKKHQSIAIILTVINLLVLWNFISAGNIEHGIGYFIFFYAALLIIHYLTKINPPKNEIEVKEPRRELSVALIFSLLGGLFLSLNFMLKADLIPNTLLTRIPIFLGSFLFAMPLGMFVYFLIKKYRILALGLTIKPLSSLLTGLVIWGLTGLFAYIFNKEGILWSVALEELGGVGGILLKGVIGAALFEEFTRFIIQSRFNKVFNSSGISILVASTIWAFMHFPVTYFKSSDLSGTLIYCFQIIPLGFLWGYLTHRTKSIVPSTIVHGLNLWGFQNG